MNITVNAAAIKEASEKLSNWGKWGKDDMSGTLNYVEPHHIVEAAKLIRKGKSFALGIPLDRSGPQSGLFGGRFNPIHQMLVPFPLGLLGGAFFFDVLGKVFGWSGLAPAAFYMIAAGVIAGLATACAEIFQAADR